MHCVRDMRLLRRLHVRGTIHANADPIIYPAGKGSISAESERASDRHRLQTDRSLYPAGFEYVRDDVGFGYPCSGGLVEHGCDNMHAVRTSWGAAMHLRFGMV